MGNLLKKRTTKNVVTVVIIAALAVGMMFTTGLIGGSEQPQMPPGQQFQQQDGQDQQGNSDQGQPPAQPSGDNSQGQPPEPPSGDNSHGQQGGSDQGQPPEPPGGDNSQGQQGGSDQEQPPEPPSGDNSQSQQDGSDQGQPPEPPSGDNSQSQQSGSDQEQPPEPPSGNNSQSVGMNVLTGAEALAIAMLIVYLIMSGFNRKSIKETLPDKKKIAAFAVASILAGGALTAAGILIPDKGNTGMPGGQPQQVQQNTQQVEAVGATTVDGDEQTLNDTYESENADENAILVTNGGTLTSDGATVNKKSGDGSNTDSCDFHGVNAGILVNGDSTAEIKNAKVTTSASMSNGVFCTGEKSTINISDSTIETTGERSCRGLDATNGGTIIADNMKIKTQGGSCAALATDRGEGTVTVTNSQLETNGAGSPIIYSTGDISIDNTKATANGSQITVVEGKNKATITNSEVTASAAGNRGDVDLCGVMLYQSMSGDADEGTSVFTSTDSTLSINEDSKYYESAPMFFVTNTDSVIKLTNTELNYGSGTLLSVKATSEWGNEGSNGGKVKLVAKNQKLEGDIEVDDISEATIVLKNGTTFEGTINGDNTAKSLTLKLTGNAKIVLTGDSYVSSLEDADLDYSNIDFNGYKLYVDGKAIQ